MRVTPCLGQHAVGRALCVRKPPVWIQRKHARG